jgi:hypothetical protein
LYALLERAVKYPKVFPSWPGSQEDGNSGPDKAEIRSELLALCRIWAEPIHSMANRTDTHDMGFMIQPSLRLDWELNGNESSLNAVITAANSLATRYNDRIGAIRSWNVLLQKEREITNLDDNFLVIIDSMCNLDLLFYVGHHTSSPKLIDMAIAHARAVMRGILREEDQPTSIASPFNGRQYSTFHVVNFDPNTTKVKQRLTHQGYSDSSTWARGQAWGVLGYAQTYMWTRDRIFLDVACGLAEYFIKRLESAPSCVERPLHRGTSKLEKKASAGRYVPLWDFDAPVDEINPLRDSSAGVIAANGMLIVYQALSALREDVLARRYLDMSMTIVEDTIALSLAKEKAQFVKAPGGTPSASSNIQIEDESKESFDAILKNATANYYEGAMKRYWDHGLVYADYYFIAFGNRLLNMGLI